MEYRLEDLIEIPLLQDLQDKLNRIYSFPSAIVDNKGQILTSVAWQDVCTKFHRKHPDCEKACIKSDQYIMEHLHEANPSVSYQCPHGLVDNAVPIIIDGQHLGNFFTGQFFLEKPDFDFFRKQAKKYEFDEKAYIEAVEKVPIWTKEKLDTYLDFITGFIEIIAGIGLKQLKEIEAIRVLKESEEKFSKVFHLNPSACGLTDINNGKYIEVNEAFYTLFGFDKNEVIGKTPTELGILTPEAINSILLKANSTGNTNDIEADLKTKNGEIKHVLLSSENINLYDKKLRFTVVHDITERKKAESILQDIIDKNPMSIQIVDTEGFTLKVNPSHTELFGAVPPPGFSIFNDLQSKSQELERLIILAKNGEVVHFPDYYYNVHDISPEYPDKPVWIHAILFPLKDSTGKYDRFVLMHENISWRKQAEEAIKENEQKFRNILESSPFQIWAFDGEIYNYVNKSYIDFTGIDSNKTLTPSTWTYYVHPDDLEAAQKIWMKAWENKAEHDNYFRLRNKHGQYRNFWCHAVPIYDEYGNFKHFQGFNIDITERKQAEENLQLHGEIVENMSEGIFLTRSSDGVIVYANPAIEKLLKATPGMLIGKHISTVNAPTDKNPDEIATEIIQCLKTSDTWHGEIKNLRMDRSTVWCSAQVSTFYHPQHGNVWIAIHQDISERKFAEAKLKESEMRAHRQREALALLAIDESLLKIELNEGFQKISKILSATVQVEMASIWLLSEDEKTLNCHSLFEATTNKYSSGATLITASIPKYLAAIQKESRIYASDVQNDTRTIELRENYLIPQGITSMLDAGILINGKLTGIVCLEHKGEKRIWETDEEAFASTVSSIIAQALINSERMKTKVLLQESEQKFREIYNSTDEAILINDAHTGQMIDCNQRAVEMYGYANKEEILNGNIIALGSNAGPYTDDKVQYNIRKAIEEGNHTFEWLAKKKNGDFFSVEVNLKIAEIVGGKRILSVVRDITERKLAEEKIREKDIQFRKLSANVSDLIYQFTRKPDGSYNVPIASEGIKNIFGCSPEDVLNDFTPIGRVIHPDDAARVIADIEYSAEHLTYFTCEFRVHIPGREIQWILSRSTPEKLPDGSITWYGFNADITERKQAEEELKQLSARFSLAVRAGGVGIWEYDIVNDTILWNDQMYKLYGINKNDFGGVYEAWQSGLHPEDTAQGNIETQLALSGEKEYNTSFRVVWPDGSIHNIRAIGSIQRNSDGQAVRMIGTNWDITDQKKTEQELIFAKEKAEESEAYYRLIFENSLDTIIWTDAKTGIIIACNAASCILTEYTEQELIGQSFAIILPPENRTEVSFDYQKHQQNKGTKSLEFPIITKSGVIKYIELAGTNIEINGKEISQGIFKDITLRKQKEQELNLAKLKAEESDRLKSAFLANMSHEIRTPMNGILGFAEILQEHDLTGEQQQEYIRIIEKSGKRMLNIINDIVSISKIESGVMEVSYRESNINHQLEYIYDFFKPEVDAKGIKISYNTLLPPNEATIKVDKEKLYAILTNLVKNAIKYTNEGSIEFGYNLKSINEVGELIETVELEFYVKDSGIGIPKDRQEAIFERFIQADIADKQAYQGAGLGLSISKAYVEMLGGKIWVESEEGIGSTFYFTLPYNAKTEENTESKNVNPSYISDSYAKKLKILIVEDDETSQLFLSTVVIGFCESVLKAQTGNKAIDICHKNPDIDLILMDILMPDMNGLEATRQIRRFNNDVVIIAQTAFALSGDREKAIEAGCNDYITKPIIKLELLGLIQKYFGNNTV
jgi:PAS domain S-box-containing protein